MSNDLKSKKAVLFGVGKMGIEYSKVLHNLGINYSVVGRSKAGVEKFTAKTGIRAFPNGFAAWKEKFETDVEFAIIAVNVEELLTTVINCMDFGIRKILQLSAQGILVGDTCRLYPTWIIIILYFWLILHGEPFV